MFPQNFTQLGKILQDRWSRRSRQISSLMALNAWCAFRESENYCECVWLVMATMMTMIFLREGASGGRVGSQGPGPGGNYLDKDWARRHKMS